MGICPSLCVVLPPADGGRQWFRRLENPPSFMASVNQCAHLFSFALLAFPDSGTLSAASVAMVFGRPHHARVDIGLVSFLVSIPM